MVRFFQIDTTFRILFAFLLLLIIRLPAFGTLEVLNPQMGWFLVGERIHQGYQLYTETWENISPLSATVFWILHSIFGKSPLAHQILATLLVLLQAYMFNHILKRYQIFSERTLVPMLVYGVLMTSFMDFLVLSPALIANTFLLFIMRYIFMQISEKRRYNGVFEIGAYLGISTLFYLPSFWFLLVPALSFALYTDTKFRDYILMFLAFFFTLGVAFLGFYMVDAEYDFYLSFFYPLFLFRIYFYVPFFEILLIFALPITIFVLSILAITIKGVTNYQNRCQTIMIIWVLVGVVAIFGGNKISAFSFMPLLIGLSFLVSQYFMYARTYWLREMLFIGIFANACFFSYMHLYQIRIHIPLAWADMADFEWQIDTKKLITKENIPYKYTTGKKIIILGESLGNYHKASLATPYLDWQMAQRHFANLDKYNIIIEIHKNFQKNMPDVIIDEKKFVPKLFAAIPVLAQKYQKSTQYPQLYIRKTP